LAAPRRSTWVAARNLTETLANDGRPRYPGTRSDTVPEIVDAARARMHNAHLGDVTIMDTRPPPDTDVVVTNAVTLQWVPGPHGADAQVVPVSCRHRRVAGHAGPRQLRRAVPRAYTPPTGRKQQPGAKTLNDVVLLEEDAVSTTE